MCREHNPENPITGALQVRGTVTEITAEGADEHIDRLAHKYTGASFGPKAAALLWNGQKKIDCKVYLDPDMRLLNQANISAHDKYSQTRFFSTG